MTTSKRVAERKIARFERSISKKGSKKGFDFGYSVTQILLSLFIFIVLALCLFQIIRTTRGRRMA